MELKLVAQHEDGNFFREFDLGPDDIRIGRSDECELTLPCNQRVVSRVHAVIQFRDGQHELKDAKSANGITIDGIQDTIAPDTGYRLSDGTAFTIGPYKIVVTATKPTRKPARVTNPGGQQAAVARKAQLPRPGSRGQSQRKAPAEQEQDEPKQDIAPEKPVSAEIRSTDSGVFKAASTDHFEPPVATIPDDWGLDPTDHETRKKPNQSNNKHPKADVLAFNQQQHRLIAALLKGMQTGDQFEAADASAEQLETLGQTFRVLMDCAMKAVHLQRKVNSRLCLDSPAVEREISKDPVFEITDGDALLKILLDVRHPRRKAIPTVLLRSLEAAIEDQQMLQETTLEITDIVINSLSPDHITTMMEQHQQHDPTHSTKSLKYRLSPDAGKWAYFEEHWSKVASQARNDVHETFEKRILHSTARRAKR